MALPKVTLLDGVHSTLQIPAPADAPSTGDILKLADNRVAIVTGLNLANIKTGDPIAVVVSGPVRFTKASNKVFTAGTRPFWDISANVPLPAGDGGLAAGDPFLAV